MDSDDTGRRHRTAEPSATAPPSRRSTSTASSATWPMSRSRSPVSTPARTGPTRSPAHDLPADLLAAAPHRPPRSADRRRDRTPRSALRRTAARVAADGPQRRAGSSCTASAGGSPASAQRAELDDRVRDPHVGGRRPRARQHEGRADEVRAAAQLHRRGAAAGGPAGALLAAGRRAADGAGGWPTAVVRAELGADPAEGVPRLAGHARSPRPASARCTARSPATAARWR